VTAAFIYTLLRLPWLAPDITTAIVNGRQPQHLNAKTYDAQGLAAPDRLGRAAPAVRILKNFRRGRDDLRTLVRTISLRTRHCSLDRNKKSKRRA
jgi:hypothetical protein